MGPKIKKNHVKWSSSLLIILKSEPFDQSSATAEKVKKKRQVGLSMYLQWLNKHTHVVLHEFGSCHLLIPERRISAKTINLL